MAPEVIASFSFSLFEVQNYNFILFTNMLPRLQVFVDERFLWILEAERVVSCMMCIFAGMICSQLFDLLLCS